MIREFQCLNSMITRQVEGHNSPNCICKFTDRILEHMLINNKNKQKGGNDKQKTPAKQKSKNLSIEEEKKKNWSETAG